MKKIITAIALSACMLLTTVFFPACGGYKDGMYLKLDNQSTVTSITALNDLKGFSSISKAGDLVLFSKADSAGYNTYKILNLKSGTIILTVSDTAETTHTINIKKNYFWAQKISNLKFTTSVYDINGGLVKTVLDKTVATNVTDYATDLIKIEEEYYRIGENGVISFAFDVDFKTMPSDSSFIGSVFGGYYSVVSGNRIFSYDKNFELKYYYTKPSYATQITSEPIMFDNGNYLIQYRVMVDETSDDFHYVQNGNKYKLITHFVNVAKKTVEEIFCEYVLNAEYYTKGNVKNSDVGLEKYMHISDDLAVVVSSDEKFEDGYMRSLEDEVILGVKGNAKIFPIENLVENQKGILIKLPNGKFMAQNVAGQYFVASERGEIIKEININIIKPNKDYFVVGSKIYDSNFNEKVDFTGYDMGEVLWGVVLLSKEDTTETGTIINYYMYKDGAKTPVNGEVVEVEDCFFIVKETVDITENYKYYNNVGNLVVALPLKLTLEVSSQDGTAHLLEAFDEDLKKVYYLAK